MGTSTAQHARNWRFRLPTLRLLLVLAIAVLTAGCGLIVDIFQAGLVVGIILVVMVLMIGVWIARKLRGR